MTTEVLWPCPHTDTFECHFSIRCVACNTDAITAKDGTLLWPSQVNPFNFDRFSIANWWLDNNLYALPQGCDGFTFARNNLLRPATYGYVWQELYLDLDYYSAYLLDVRRSGMDGHEERQFLFVGVKHCDLTAALWHDVHVPFRMDGGERMISALRWFPDVVESWLEGE